jgi:hypothetical protein
MRTVTFLPGWVGSSDSIVHRPGRAVAHDSYRWPSQLALGGQGLQQLPMGAARKTQITDHTAMSPRTMTSAQASIHWSKRYPGHWGLGHARETPTERKGGVADDRLRPSQSQSRRVGDTPPSAQTTEGNQLQASPTSWPPSWQAVKSSLRSQNMM